MDRQPVALRPYSEVRVMNKVSDYRAHAQECRMMAKRNANQEHRQLLLSMAETWDMLAEERLRKLEKEGREAD